MQIKESIMKTLRPVENCKVPLYLCKALKTFVLICMNNFLKSNNLLMSSLLKICRSIDDVTIMTLRMRAINDDITKMTLGMRTIEQCTSARNPPQANNYSEFKYTI